MSAVRPAIKSSLFLAFLATLASAYFVNTPLPLFLVRLKEVCLALILLCSAGGLGSRVLAKRQTDLTPLEQFIFAEALGVGLISWLMIFFGAARAWTPLYAWGLILAGLLASKPFLINLKNLFSFTSEEGLQPVEYLWPGIALIFGSTVSCLLAFAPVTYYDSLVYHFTLPQAYIHAQRWVPLPELIYSAFPQALEMLWTLCLLIGSDVVANLIGCGLGLLLLLAIIAFARRFLQMSVGLMAAALISVMPAFLLLSSGGYVDVGLALFSFMSLYAACLWLARPDFVALISAGLFAGLAMGTKYTGALPTLLTLLLLTRRRDQRFRGVMTFCGAALLMVAPWLVKNMIYVGNPVFPFFYNWGLQALNPWLNQGAAGYFAGITEYTSQPVWQLPWVVWEAATNGLRFGGGMDVLGDFGWAPLIGFLPALWLCRQWPSLLKLLLAYSGLYLVFWAANRPVLRFLLPLSPVLALLVAHAWIHGIRTQVPAVRWLARGILGAFLLSGLFLFFYSTHVMSSFPPALGLESREHYLTRKLNYYAAASFINNQTPADSHVYIFGDQRGYYYQRKIWISPVFSKDPLTQWANDARTPRDLLVRIQLEGLTHLMVNRAEYKRLGSYLYDRFNDQGKRNWEKLPGLLQPVYHDNACDVYAL